MIGDGGRDISASRECGPPFGADSVTERGDPVRMRYRAVAALTLVVLVGGALALVAGSTKSSSSGRSESETRGLGFVKRNVDIFSKKGGGDSPASYADQMAQLNAYPG